MDTTLPQHLAENKNEWDDYWNKQNRGGWLYAVIAEFYRVFIIRPNLNRFIRNNFSKGAYLLHAGCGSGQVDAGFCDEYAITGMDISPRALEIYKESNPHGKTLLSSIFAIGLPDKSVDGIYNLGVMEHFTEAEIVNTLKEFRRVLKDSGKILLFWPPEFGLSVLFFKSLKGSIKLLTGKDVKFHPDEISRVRSRAHVEKLLGAGGFSMRQYSFGPRDVFTYSIIVGEKTL